MRPFNSSLIGLPAFGCSGVISCDIYICVCVIILVNKSDGLVLSSGYQSAQTLTLNGRPVLFCFILIPATYIKVKAF